MRRTISPSSHPRSASSPHALHLARRTAVALAAAVITCAASPASAQDTTAEAVFEEGVKLFEAGNFAGACPKLKSAVKLSSSEALGGRLVLAECYEKVGKWASAWALYRELVGKAASAGQQARREKAEAGQARTEPKLARIKLELAPALASIAGLTIERDGETIPREAWDLALPVDPGPVVIKASAPGKRAAEQTVTIEDAPATKPVRLEPLADEPAGAPVSPPVAPPPQPPPSDAPPPEDDGGIGGLGIAGIAIGGVGLVGIGVSALVAVGAKSSYDDAKEKKDATGITDAQGTGNAATGVFVAGAVLTAVGATLLIVDLSSSGGSASASRFTLRTAGLGARAEGSF